MRYTKEFYSRGSVIQDNISEIWQQRTYKDYQDGKDWYKEANKFSLDLAEKFQVAPVVSAGVTSALSANKHWEENKLIVRHFFERVKKAPISGWKDTKHWRNQKIKAWRIYKRCTTPEQVAKELNGLKTTNFFYNIYNPDDNQYFTIDRHQIFIALSQKKQKLTTKQYNFLKEEYIKFAKLVNMKPVEMQAILWLTIRRVKKDLVD